MSKKTLLNEATVRRFMKLANVGTLSNGFINEAGIYEEEEDEFPDPEEEEGDEPEGDLPAPGEGDVPLEDEPEVDLSGEEGEGASDEVEITEDDRAALAAAIPVLEKIAGPGEELGGEELMEPEEGAELPPLEEEVLDEVELIDEKELVQEVTRRVAQRLRSVLKKRK